MAFGHTYVAGWLDSAQHGHSFQKLLGGATYGREAGQVRCAGVRTYPDDRKSGFLKGTCAGKGAGYDPGHITHVIA
jgi:hypothetical protein